MKKRKSQGVAQAALVGGGQGGIFPEKVPERGLGLRVGKVPCHVEGVAEAFHQSSITLRRRSSGSLTPICTTGPAAHSQLP